MTLVFQTLVDRLASAKRGEDLSQAMRRFADAFGLSNFTYLDFRRPGSHPPVYLTTYPTEWIFHYASRRYQEIDPVVVEARRSMAPFFWDDRSPGIDPSIEQRRLFGEAAEFGICCGLTVPVHDARAGLAMLSFTSDREPAKTRCDIIAHSEILHLASIYFHVHARRCLEGCVVLDAAELDPQETASLQWVARGKSFWEIGEILGMSRHMVVRLAANAKRKLNASSLSHAIALALYYRIIEL
jgi:LuxR family transcriptional regulator, activator of conjugal transfer of Ti plasmids